MQSSKLTVAVPLVFKLAPNIKVLLVTELNIPLPLVLICVPNMKPLLVTVDTVSAPAALNGPLELMLVPLI